MKKINLLKVSALAVLLLVGCGGTGTSAGTGSQGGGNTDASTLTHYTESWRSVKTEGWGILSSVKNDATKLEAALKLVDYMYSDAGNQLMSYGPSEYGFIATNTDGSIKTIDYQGEQVPQLSEGTLSQLATLAKNNYTNYYRYFVGATLPVGYVKAQGMEYQCTHEAGKEGLAKINKNVEVGTLKHPSVGEATGETGANVEVQPMATKTTLKLSILYKEKESEPKFVAGGKADNGYTDPAGNTYNVGDWKPTWKALQNRLNIGFDNVVAGKDVAANYTAAKANSFAGIDLITGKAASINEDGTNSGAFLNLLEYKDRMPNFANFLEANPIVKKTVTTSAYSESGTSTESAIYYAPYFDGFDDIERMTLLREDWLVKLLDAENPTFDTKAAGGAEVTTVYTAQAKFNDTVKVAASLTSNETKDITKSTVEGNIIDTQNALEVKDGASLANALREYIDTKYAGVYSKRSDLFNGVDAAYDADEFIALLRAVKANGGYLTGGAAGTEVVPFYPRANTNDRVSDIFRWGGNLWGVNGTDSRSGFLYIDADGLIQDARGDEKTGKMLENLNAIYKEGLILKDFESVAAAGGEKGAYNTDLGAANRGFASYDYCQTQTALNYNGYADGQYKLVPIMGAVSDVFVSPDLVPTTFRLTADELNRIGTEFTNINQVTYEKGKTSLWTKYVMAGFGGTYGEGESAQQMEADVAGYVKYMEDNGVTTLEGIYTNAYSLM